jgi:hypothetical protein
VATTTERDVELELPPEPLPRWSALTIIIGGGLLGFLCLLVSAVSIYELCIEGFLMDPVRAVAVALVVDTGLVIGTAAWIGGRRSRRRYIQKTGQVVTKAMTAGSVVLNAAEMAHLNKLLPVPVLIAAAILVAAVAPLGNFAMNHLVIEVLDAMSDRPKKAKAKPKAAPVAEPVDEQPGGEDATVVDIVDEIPTPPEGLREVLAGTALAIVEAVEKLATATDGPPVGPKAIAAVSGISRATVNRHLSKLVADGHLVKNADGAYAPAATAA